MAYPVQTDPTAVFGRRVLAALIDAALIFIPVIMLLTSSWEYYEADTLRSQGRTGADVCDDVTAAGGDCADLTDVDSINRVYFSDGDTGASPVLLWGATVVLFVLLQGITGWTPGKLIFGVRCVGEDGRPPGFVKALVRWLLWIVDGFPYILPLVGFIVGLTTVGHRRVGDMAAKTFVVGRASAGAPIVVPGLTAPVPPATAWGAPPPDESGATTGWGPAVDPSSAGWASPSPDPAPPIVPVATPAASPAPGTESPQWDDARGTYIQWDPSQGAWMQWNDGTKAWSRIPGQ
jgi:uncharacterized RDD family membrane protein YckC